MINIIIFPRWYFPYNLGDTVMLSSLFRAVKEQSPSKRLIVISDATTIETFNNDPHVEQFIDAPSWVQSISKKIYPLIHKIPFLHIIWPGWKSETYAILRENNNLHELIDASYKNILSINYAVQINKELAHSSDLRPRIYLENHEIESAREKIEPNSIGIHIARIRGSQSRKDQSEFRYNLHRWKKLCQLLKEELPKLTIYEIGDADFRQVGDKHIPIMSIRETAAHIHCMDLVILSDGGIHNICNAIDKKVLLFQAYEWNPPELFKMGNAIFSPQYHPDCRKRCHIFTDILQTASAKESCQRECYNLPPENLAHDCISHLKQSHSTDEEAEN